MTDPSAPDPTTHFVRAAVAGDEQGIDALIERFTPFLLAQARYRLAGPAAGHCEPEDIVANRLDPWHGVHFHPHSFVKLEMLDNKRPENMSLKEREHLTFTYDKIAWTWVDGGISAEDDWEAPNA